MSAAASINLLFIKVNTYPASLLQCPGAAKPDFTFCLLTTCRCRYNGVLPGDWKWFPVGTFTANISACMLDYAVKAALARATLDAVSTALLSGVVSGIGGCLSTVSTWVVEVGHQQHSLIVGSWPHTYS